MLRGGNGLHEDGRCPDARLCPPILQTDRIDEKRKNVYVIQTCAKVENIRVPTSTFIKDEGAGRTLERSSHLFKVGLPHLTLPAFGVSNVRASTSPWHSIRLQQLHPYVNENSPA